MLCKRHIFFTSSLLIYLSRNDFLKMLVVLQVMTHTMSFFSFYFCNNIWLKPVEAHLLHMCVLSILFNLCSFFLTCSPFWLNWLYAFVSVRYHNLCLCMRLFFFHICCTRNVSSSPCSYFWFIIAMDFNRSPKP